MLRQLPKFNYIGLTIIMSNPSRFDTKELMSGNGGFFFKEECLRPQANIWQCDVRLIDDKSPLLPNTKVILLLGEKAHKLYTKLDTSLDENRGSPIVVNTIPCISSFAPQDCVDIKNYEKSHNENYQTVEEFMSEELAAGEVFESKGRGKTKRSNYRFWLQQDTKKALRILDNNGRIPSPPIGEPEYIIKPSSEEIIHLLTSTKGDYLYYDMETDFTSLDMRCFAFAFGKKPEKVYVVPTLDIDYKYAYSRLPQIIRAKSISIRDNILVAHNGALFDFLVLALKYRIPIGRSVYDTMVASQRIFPDVEKSLGHGISLATYLPYHKNEGVHSYMNQQQADQLYLYCGKDVYGMILLHLWQQEQMAKNPGLKASIEQAQRAIKPYLIQTYLGMKYDTVKQKAWLKENDRLMVQYMRIIKALTGDDVDYLISSKKCKTYFADLLGYPIVKRKADTGAPSYDEGALLMLKQRFPENVVIDFLLRYRARKKETGELNFKPWIPEQLAV